MSYAIRGSRPQEIPKQDDFFLNQVEREIRPYTVGSGACGMKPTRRVVR